MNEIKKRKPPKGLVIIIILTVISGLILLTMSLISFSILLPLRPDALAGSSFLFILGVSSIIVSSGLYKGKGWSWSMLLVLSGFGAAGYLLNLVNGNAISIIGVVFNAIIIYYIYRPNVRRYFAKR